MTRLDDRLVAELARVVRERIPVPVPGWIDQNDSDPGVTLVALFAFLGEELLHRAPRLAPAPRAELVRIATRLADAGTRDEAVAVSVNAHAWRPVPALEEEAPDAPAFVLDGERGVVRFGNGVHGRTPPDGADLRVRYRTGTHGHAADVAIATRWPLSDAAWTLETRAQGEIVLTECGRAGRVMSPGLTRVAFFTGRLLTAEDLRAEQDYIRSRFRRLNRAAHGVGVITGLELSVLAEDGGAAPAVSVSPGVAVDPDGEELVVPSAITCPIDAGGEILHVLLRYVERPASAGTVNEGTTAELRPTRIEEGFAVSVEPEPDPCAVFLGRLVRHASAWRVEGGNPA